MQRDLLLLGEMIEAAEQAQRLVEGYTAAEVGADRMRRDSLLWNLAVLGEAATLVSDETRARFPEIPWRNPTRLRARRPGAVTRSVSPPRPGPRRTPRS